MDIHEHNARTTTDKMMITFKRFFILLTSVAQFPNSFVAMHFGHYFN